LIFLRDAEGDVGRLDPLEVLGGHAVTGEALHRDQAPGFRVPEIVEVEAGQGSRD
jgi:hypothetical protein